MATGNVKVGKVRATPKAVPVRSVDGVHASAPRLRAVREEYGLGRQLFARLVGVTPATLARWERAGKPPTTAEDKVRQVGKLLRGLSRVMPKADLAGWLTSPNDACRSAGGRTPAELMEKGRYDKIEAMIYFFESGVAY
jgi:DNA-binding XRE family transcriptional regulator